MNKNIWISTIKSSLLSLPTPINISYWWNFGSLLGLFLGIQLISGFFLSMHFCPNTLYAFDSIIHMIQNVNLGWLFHNIHINGATMFFICLYNHIGRGLYYNSFKIKNPWLIGVSIFLISMTTAFLGYVLPWGQMSFWGATVITNLLSTIPYMGKLIVEWLWGGYSINNATLNRFYSLHFILPFLIMFFVFLHIFFLHITGSNNPLGVNSNLYKLSFHNYFTFKDLFTFMIFYLFLLIIILQYPYIFSDPDNFSKANSMITPIHIQPEWYFLFAYAILRSIPNKLGGVIALISAILILYTLPFIINMTLNSSSFYPFNQFMFWMFVNTFILLTWSGAQPIEYPFSTISQILSFLYFIYFLIIMLFSFFWDKFLFNI